MNSAQASKTRLWNFRRTTDRTISARSVAIFAIAASAEHLISRPNRLISKLHAAGPASQRGLTLFWARNLPNAMRLSVAWGTEQEADMNGLIYLVGLIVVIMAVLSLFGLR